MKPKIRGTDQLPCHGVAVWRRCTRQPGRFVSFQRIGIEWFTFNKDLLHRDVVGIAEQDNIRLFSRSQQAEMAQAKMLRSRPAGDAVSAM